MDIAQDGAPLETPASLLGTALQHLVQLRQQQEQHQQWWVHQRIQTHT